MMSKNNKKRYQIPKISVTKFEMDKTIMESPTDAGDIVTFDSEYESATTISDLLFDD